MTTRPTSDTSSTGTASGYVFDNAGQPTAQRFTGLAAVYDPGTIRHLTARGVGPGWQCLEVGAGGGSIAVWLAEEVGPSGTVVATDIDTRFLDGLARPNLEIRRHDIATDPLPAAAFDLVHTRLVLVHLPTRDAVLARLVAALRPGGWLVVEEFGAPALQPDPVLDPAEVPLKAHAVLQQVTAVHGVDNLYGRRIAGRLRALGLVDIGAEGHAFLWSGGSAGARVVQAGIAQLREAIVATGHVTEQELEDDLARLEDPALAWPSPRLMWSVWGRRPAAPEGEAAQRRSGAREPARETFRRVVREAGEAGLPHYQAYAALGYAEEHLGSRVADAAMLDTALTAMRPLGGPLYARVLARSLGYGSLPGSIAERRALAEQAVAIAVESGDVLAHYHALGTKGVFDPLPQDQLAGAQEMQRLAQQLGDDELLADSLRATVSPLLALGRIDEMAAAVAAYTRIAERLRQPFFRSWPALWQASRALRDGRLAEVEALAEQALGEEAGSLNAWFYYTEQLTLLRLLEGRAGELYALLDDPRQHPASEVLGSRKARALAAEGRLAEARSLPRADSRRRARCSSVSRHRTFALSCSWRGGPCPSRWPVSRTCASRWAIARVARVSTTS